MKRNNEIIDKLLRNKTEAPEIVSLKKFIEINFQAFIQSGKPTREIYEFLKGEGVDVGKFEVFKTLYSKVKRSWKQKTAASAELFTPRGSSPSLKEPPILSREPYKHPQKKTDADEHKTKQSKYNPALPPILLPGGIEAIIDPETGAKRFEI